MRMNVSPPKGNFLSCTLVFWELKAYLRNFAQRSDTVALQNNGSGRWRRFTEVILNVKM